MIQNCDPKTFLEMSNEKFLLKSSLRRKKEEFHFVSYATFNGKCASSTHPLVVAFCVLKMKSETKTFLAIPLRCAYSRGVLKHPYFILARCERRRRRKNSNLEHDVAIQ